MTITIVEESPADLPAYEEISIAFQVTALLRIDQIDGGLGGFRLTEESVEAPCRVDFDSDGDSPSSWPGRWNLENWGILSAFDGEKRVGGAVIACRTAGVRMLEGRDDLAVLWDIRIDPAYRGRGVGTLLFEAVVTWVKERGYRLLKIETQNTNVDACRFYAKQGCELGAIRRFAYANAPDEVQLLWYLDFL